MACENRNRCSEYVKKSQINTTSKNDWGEIKDAKDLGYVCNFWSSTQSIKPIRRFEDMANGNKLEPHYEEKTYGEKACCNRHARNICIREKRKYIFFATRYHGTLKDYRCNEHKYSIVGYYVINEYKDVSGTFKACNRKIQKNNIQCKNYYDEKCYAVKADRILFTTIEKSFPLYSEDPDKPHENLELIFGKHAVNDEGHYKKWIYEHNIRNSRHIRGRVGKEATKFLLNYFTNIKKKYPEHILPKNVVEIEQISKSC